jgi:hypothetical protein
MTILESIPVELLLVGLSSLLLKFTVIIRSSWAKFGLI